MLLLAGLKLGIHLLMREVPDSQSHILSHIFNLLPLIAHHPDLKEVQVLLVLVEGLHVVHHGLDFAVLLLLEIGLLQVAGDDSAGVGGRVLQEELGDLLGQFAHVIMGWINYSGLLWEIGILIL